MSSIQRDKYITVKEERDAYQQMQTHFTSEINIVTETMQSSSQENERLEVEIAQAKEVVQDTFQIIKRLLAVVAIGDDDLISPSACDSIASASEALERRVQDMRLKLDAEKLDIMEVGTRCIFFSPAISLSSVFSYRSYIPPLVLCALSLRRLVGYGRSMCDR